MESTKDEELVFLDCVMRSNQNRELRTEYYLNI